MFEITEPYINDALPYLATLTASWILIRVIRGEVTHFLRLVLREARLPQGRIGRETINFYGTVFVFIVVMGFILESTLGQRFLFGQSVPTAQTELYNHILASLVIFGFIGAFLGSLAICGQ